MATIFAWSGALRKRGELDGIKELQSFADRLERASTETIESGIMTKDIASIADIYDKKVVTTEEFLHAVAEKLK
jgi:isocitrate dehydrogenase